MKLAEIIEILSAQLGTSDLKEINKALKSKDDLKLRITGEALGHFGYTGPIKSIGEEGVKIFKSNKVSLVPLKEIETFGKAKPRQARPERKVEEKKPAKTAKPKFANDEDEGLEFKKKKLKKSSAAGKSGSRFIPPKK